MKGIHAAAGVVALVVLEAANSAPSAECAPDALIQAYNDLVRDQRTNSEVLDKCTIAIPQKGGGNIRGGVKAVDWTCYADNMPLGIDAIETDKRFKSCADAGSATGAGLYAQRLVERLATLKWSESQPDYESTRIELARALGHTSPTAADVANEALGYLQKSYSLDHSQAGSAEGAADLLASGDVGAGRRFEALDWYYKAGTGYMLWNLPADVKRQQTTRVLEKMAAIDRENPLTKKLESQVYK